MIDGWNLSSHWQDPQGRGMLFFQEGSKSSIAVGWELTKGINHLFYSYDEIQERLNDVWTMLDGFQTFDGNKGMFCQICFRPDFDVDDICDGMDSLLFIDNEYKKMHRELLDETKNYLRYCSKNKAITRYKLYLTARYYPGVKLADNFRNIIKTEEQIIFDELLSLEEIVEEFEKMEEHISEFSPKMMGCVDMVNIIRAHFGLEPISNLPENGRALQSYIFPKAIDVSQPDHTRVIIDGNSKDGGEQDIYLRTYSVDGICGRDAFMGANLCDFDGDFSITQSFVIPDNKKMTKLLDRKLLMKKIVLSVKWLRKYVNEEQEEENSQALKGAIQHIFTTGEKRGEIATHLTLRKRGAKRDKRIRHIDPYFSKAKFDGIRELHTQPVINMASAMPFSFSIKSYNCLRRHIPVKLSEMSSWLMMFSESEGADSPYIVGLTNKGIYKRNPFDPKLGKYHSINLGYTRAGKTFDTEKIATAAHRANMNCVLISSKDDYDVWTNILGGVHSTPGEDGSRIPPFSMPERARQKDKKGNLLWSTSMSYMIDLLQFMTDNYDSERKYDYNRLLDKLFTEKECDNASISRVGEQLKSMDLEREYKSLMNYSKKGAYGDLFDSEKGYDLDIFDNNLISVDMGALKGLDANGFDLVNRIFFKKTIDFAVRKKGTTLIVLDEIKDMLRDKRRAELVGDCFSLYASFGAFCIINDQEGAFLEEGPVAKTIRSNTARFTFFGLAKGDSITGKLFGLNETEDELCKNLAKKAGKWAELYHFVPEREERQLIRSFTTPFEHAINTTAEKDRQVYRYIFEKYYEESKQNKRYSYLAAAYEFARVFPEGVEQHPQFNMQYIKHKSNLIDIYRELKEQTKGELRAA